MIVIGMTQVSVNLVSELANDPDASVDDGESFLTVAKDKSTGTYHLYQPNRSDYEFVALGENLVDSLDSDRVEENSRFKIWGNKESWDKTPSSVFNF